MQIVRCLYNWDGSRLKDEIPNRFEYGDEVVYVWGKYQYDYLVDRGYKCILVSRNKFYTERNNLNHKIDTFEMAGNDFGEFIFIDWDVTVQHHRKIDDKFYDSFRGNCVMCSLYGYPKSFLELKHSTWKSEHNNYVKVIKKEFKRYNIGWKLDEFVLIPNTGITYFSSNDVVKEYLKVHKRYGFDALSDELTMFKFLNVSLDEFIQKYMTTAMYGRPSEVTFSYTKQYKQKNTNRIVNSYIDSKKNMDCYLFHNHG